MKSAPHAENHQYIANMTHQEFTYYLQGFFENVNPTSINEEQTALIKEKLQSCFNKVTGQKQAFDDYKYEAWGGNILQAADYGAVIHQSC